MMVKVGFVVMMVAWIAEYFLLNKMKKALEEEKELDPEMKNKGWGCGWGKKAEVKVAAPAPVPVVVAPTIVSTAPSAVNDSFDYSIYED